MESKNRSSFLALSFAQVMLVILGIMVLVVVVEMATGFQGYGFVFGIVAGVAVNFAVSHKTKSR